MVNKFVVEELDQENRLLHARNMRLEAEVVVLKDRIREIAQTTKRLSDAIGEQNALHEKIYTVIAEELDKADNRALSADARTKKKVEIIDALLKVIRLSSRYTI
jgi:hypothetical protein